MIVAAGTIHPSPSYTFIVIQLYVVLLLVIMSWQLLSKGKYAHEKFQAVNVLYTFALE